jgi:hypothetical protein
MLTSSFHENRNTGETILMQHELKVMANDINSMFTSSFYVLYDEALYGQHIGQSSVCNSQPLA